MDKQSLQLLLDQGLSVERIAKRFGKDPSTISYWLRKHGLESPYAEKHAAKGGIEREQLGLLVDDGMTIAEIADAVGLSKGTVRHWLRVYGLRTVRFRGDRLKLAKAAKEAGLISVVMSCRRHGETGFILEGRGYYRCKQCRAESVVRHRQKVKETLVAEAGGRCVACGYSRNIKALQFHHLDPGEKRLALSGQGVAYSLERLRSEARKCVLLCATCHAEVESGDLLLPARVDPGDSPSQQTSP
jgi:transposase-like protein